jgi:cytochrome c6
MFLFIPVIAVSAEDAAKPKAGSKVGEELFQKHCITCHAGGGNIINPKKSINRKSLAARNITTPEQIVAIMRNPKSPMAKFDQKTISDKDAKVLAEYVLDTFK